MSKNFNTYIKLNKKGLENKYVVIVKGKLFDKGENIEEMLDKVMKKYPKEVPFVAKVPNDRLLVYDTRKIQERKK